MPVDRERERDGRQVLVEIFFYGNSIHDYVRTTELRIRVTRTSSIADSLRGRGVTREFDIRESRLFGGIDDRRGVSRARGLTTRIVSAKKAINANEDITTVHPPPTSPANIDLQPPLGGISPEIDCFPFESGCA